MVLCSNMAKMHRKLIDTLELIIKKKSEEIVNKGQNKKQKTIALNRRQRTKQKTKKQSPSTEDDCFLVFYRKCELLFCALVSHSLLDLFFYLLAQLGVVAEQLLRSVTALCQLAVVIREP